MGKDTVREMTQAEREELFEEEVQEKKKLSPLQLHLLEHSYDCQEDMRDYEKLSEPEIAYNKKVIKSGLTFKQAFQKMLEGKKIARPSFIGFWYIDSFDGKMKIHDRFGNTLERVDMTITVINTLANDWEVIE